MAIFGYSVPYGTYCRFKSSSLCIEPGEDPHSDWLQGHRYTLQVQMRFCMSDTYSISHSIWSDWVSFVVCCCCCFSHYLGL